MPEEKPTAGDYTGQLHGGFTGKWDPGDPGPESETRVQNRGLRSRIGDPVQNWGPRSRIGDQIQYQGPVQPFVQENHAMALSKALKTGYGEVFR